MYEFPFPVVPIAFSWRGRSYAGEFAPVRGAGTFGNHWHLSIGGYHYGELFYSGEKFGWQWGSNKDWFAGMADYFADYLMAYIG